MLSFILLGLVSVAIGQQPRPCTAPSQWEGRVFSQNEKLKVTVRDSMSYDAIYHRQRFIQSVDIGGDVGTYDILSLYDDRLRFVYELKTGKCSRFAFNEPWSDYTISPSAQSYGEAYIGSSASADTGLLVSIWLVNTSCTFPR